MNINNLNKINVAKSIATHLIGKNHTSLHRRLVGISIMIVGVIISKSAPDSYFLLHLVFDGGGYLVHAIGGIPFIEWIVENSKEEVIEEIEEGIKDL